MFDLKRTLREPRTLADAYVVFRSIETTLADGSKVYDVVARAVVGGEITDVAFCKSELEAATLAARLNSALLRDSVSDNGYLSALAAPELSDRCPG